MGNKKKKVLTTALAYINKIAPTHTRNSCSSIAESEGKLETVDSNGAYKEDDGGACFRCTLMGVHNLTLKNEEAPQPEEDE